MSNREILQDIGYTQDAATSEIARNEHKSDKGNWFKVLKTTKGYVWTPISCFLAVNWRGPFATEQEAIAAGKANW